MLGRESPPSRLLFAVAITLALGGALIFAVGLLAALPALVAFLPLLAGHYLGADKLDALIERRVGSRAKAVSLPSPARTRPATFAIRGGRLLAASLAERPPPHAPALA
jgi:hypothetical protein